MSDLLVENVLREAPPDASNRVRPIRRHLADPSRHLASWGVVVAGGVVSLAVGALLGGIFDGVPVRRPPVAASAGSPVVTPEVLRRATADVEHSSLVALAVGGRSRSGTSTARRSTATGRPSGSTSASDGTKPVTGAGSGSGHHPQAAPHPQPVAGTGGTATAGSSGSSSQGDASAGSGSSAPTTSSAASTTGSSVCTSCGSLSELGALSAATDGIPVLGSSLSGVVGSATAAVGSVVHNLSSVATGVVGDPLPAGTAASGSESAGDGSSTSGSEAAPTSPTGGSQSSVGSVPALDGVGSSVATMLGDG